MFYFVTGTDTDSGKTVIASSLLHLAKKQGLKTLGIKPIASGCVPTPQGLRNADALSLIGQSSLQLDYQQHNPFAFMPAIAPHIAAAEQGQTLNIDRLVAHLKPLIDQTNTVNIVEFGIIEGAGGWRLPLGQGKYLSELVQQLDLPVILVVGMKLGCLNHALLTQEAILADGLTIAGWVANQVDPNMSVYQENLDTLKQMMSAPLLGVVEYQQQVEVEQIAKWLSLPR